MSSMDVDTHVDSPNTENKEATEPSASAASASKYPDMELAQQIHRLLMLYGSDPLLDAEGAAAVGIPNDMKESVLKEIASEIENPALYRHVVQSVLHTDPGLLSEAELTAMEDKHKATMEEIEKEVEEAKESAGDMEVLDARLKGARFAAKSMGKEEALDAYDKVLALPKLSSGKKIDALMECSRVASFHGDTLKNEQLLEKVRMWSVVYLHAYLM